MQVPESGSLGSPDRLARIAVRRDPGPTQLSLPPPHRAIPFDGKGIQQILRTVQFHLCAAHVPAVIHVDRSGIASNAAASARSRKSTVRLVSRFAGMASTRWQCSRSAGSRMATNPYTWRVDVLQRIDPSRPRCGAADATTVEEELCRQPVDVRHRKRLPGTRAQIRGLNFTNQRLPWVASQNDRLHHYLGYKRLVGAQMRYAVEDRTGLPLAMLGFSTAAWKIALRDRFIGWSTQTRENNLSLVVDNSRFLIRPWVRVPNLASHILSIVRRRLPEDWRRQYAINPVLIETFVETPKFTGATYRASGWIHVGTTQGRGRYDTKTSTRCRKNTSGSAHSAETGVNSAWQRDLSHTHYMLMS